MTTFEKPNWPISKKKNQMLYSRANLRWRVKALLKITHLWTRLDEFWSYLLDQRKFFISSLHLSNWFFEIIHLVMTQGKICFITFLKKRRHDWHLVNSRSNWDHFKNWEQTPSDFWPQIQAKIGSSSLSSNKLVLITWFCNHQMIFNFSESLLIFRSQLAPSVQPQRFVAVFTTKYFVKKPPWSIIYIEMYTQ